MEQKVESFRIALSEKEEKNKTEKNGRKFYFRPPLFCQKDKKHLN